MKKVLVITYYWPPGAGPGVQRWLKFCKYLSEYDWDPIVLTVENGSYPSTDKSLEKDIPERVIVRKTKTFEPFNLYNLLRGKKGKSSSVGMIGFKDNRSLMQRIANYVRANYFIPDARMGWNSYAFKEAKRIMKKHDISAIISTGPPQSTHLIAKKLKEKFGTPWIADFRDPWVNVYYNKFFPRTDQTVKKDQQLEDSVLKTADHVSVVSQGLKNEFSTRTEQIKVLYNGFDDADLEGVSDTRSTEKFVISYIGNFKPNQNVQLIWKVLGDLIVDNESLKNDLKLHFVGNVDPKLVEDIKACGLANNTEFESFVDHSTAVQYMRNASLLLFIIPQVKDNDLILTGKLFEYMACGSHMLSVGPEDGNAAAIIEECERGKMIDYNDEMVLSSAIKLAYNNWKNNNLAKLPMNDTLKKYSRKGQTEALANLLNKITADG